MAKPTYMMNSRDAFLVRTDDVKFAKMAVAIYMRLMQMDAYAIAFKHELGVEPCRQVGCVREFLERMNSGQIEWRSWLRRHFDQFGSNNRLPQEFHDAMVRINPGNKTLGSKPVPVTVDMVEAGPPIWRDLHTSAIAWDGTSESMQAIMRKVTKELPCGTCKQGWVQILSEIPLRASTADEFFAWTVEAHNRVNLKLGKPTMDVSTARMLYSQPS